MIAIRHYKAADARALWALFYHTVRNINVRDYTQAQVEAWAPAEFDAAIWQQRMRTIDPFVAEMDGDIVGYADLQADGLIDHFFCHHQHQGKGVGRSLMEHILNVGRQRGITEFHAEVSITARPFFERFGFTVVHEQMVEVRGQTLRNFVMKRSVKNPLNRDTQHVKST